jgi:hypothetical protein
LAERLQDIFLPWFVAAFDKAALTERVRWEVGFGVGNSPHGPVPMVQVYADLPAATLGQTHALAGHLPAAGLTQEVVERETRVIVEKLLSMRSEALAQTNGNGGNKIMWPPPPDGAPPLRPPGA